MEKKELKPRLSSSLYVDMSTACSFFVREFCQHVKPLLELFGFGSDEGINQFLRCISTEDIYNAAVEKDRQRVDFLHDMYKARGEDLWAGFREEGCHVRSPHEDGFVFRQMPYAHALHREKWIKAVSVKNGRIQIDEKLLEQESMVYPSQRRQDCYAGAAAFCDWLKEKNFKIDHRKLFYYDKHGQLTPNDKYILFANTSLD